MEPLAQMIHSKNSFLGIPVTDQICKFTLFVDDIILTLTEPPFSLSVVCDVLDQFNACSFYKVNETRSNILNVRVNNYKKHTKYTIPYQWVSLSMQYLGISLTTPSTALFSRNYTYNCHTCRQDLQQINKQHLSWAGRTAAFKMFTLPKLLYLHRAIPIDIPKNIFKSIQQMLRS